MGCESVVIIDPSLNLIDHNPRVVQAVLVHIIALEHAVERLTHSVRLRVMNIGAVGHRKSTTKSDPKAFKYPYLLGGMSI